MNLKGPRGEVYSTNISCAYPRVKKNAKISYLANQTQCFSTKIPPYYQRTFDLFTGETKAARNENGRPTSQSRWPTGTSVLSVTGTPPTYGSYMGVNLY